MPDDSTNNGSRSVDAAGSEGQAQTPGAASGSQEEPAARDGPREGGWEDIPTPERPARGAQGTEQVDDWWRDGWRWAQDQWSAGWWSGAWSSWWHSDRDDDQGIKWRGQPERSRDFSAPPPFPGLEHVD
eukprot:4512654-Pyramimonas_sp.AAC.1